MGWWPDYVHPMDDVSETSSETLVGFLETPVRQTELERSAYFIKESEMRDLLPITFQTKTGFSCAFWLKALEDIDRLQNVITIDNQLFIKLKDGKLLIEICADSSCNENIEVFSHAALELNVWNFLAISYETKSKKLVLYINETYGLEDNEGHTITLSDNFWFGKDLPEGETGFNIYFSSSDDDSGFFGELSCIQIYTKYLLQSQIYQVSKVCHVSVEHPRANHCQPNSFKIGDYCYSFLGFGKSYDKAETYCTSHPNSGKPSRMGYPKEYQYQQVPFPLFNPHLFSLYTLQFQLSDYILGFKCIGQNSF